MRENNPTDGGVLDALLHQPVRTQIVAYLVGRSEATFTELKRVMKISDGNLESHLKKLIAVDYIVSRKDMSGTRQQTLYLLTESGRVALQAYLASLERLLGVHLRQEHKAAEPALDGFPAGKLGWR